MNVFYTFYFVVKISIFKGPEFDPKFEFQVCISVLNHVLQAQTAQLNIKVHIKIRKVPMIFYFILVFHISSV